MNVINIYCHGFSGRLQNVELSEDRACIIIILFISTYFENHEINFISKNLINVFLHILLYDVLIYYTSIKTIL